MTSHSCYDLFEGDLEESNDNTDGQWSHVHGDRPSGAEEDEVTESYIQVPPDAQAPTEPITGRIYRGPPHRRRRGTP